MVHKSLYLFSMCGAVAWWLEHQTVNREDRGLSLPAAVEKLEQLHPTLLVSSTRDTKSCWSLLPGVYTTGSKGHTQGRRVACRGLTLICDCV